MTSHKSTIVGFVIAHIYALLGFCINYSISLYPIRCGLSETVILKYYLMYDVPFIVLVAAIASCCLIIRFRLKHHILRVNDLHTSNQNMFSSSKIATLKRNIITTYIIISAAFIAYIPREIYLFWIFATRNAHTAQSLRVVEILSISTLLNPLIDPVVYLQRMKVFRKELRCRCGLVNTTTVVGDAQVNGGMQQISNTPQINTKQRTYNVKQEQETVSATIGSKLLKSNESSFATHEQGLSRIAGKF